MLAATREIILDKLLKLPPLIDAYQRNEVSFVEQANHWLKDVEQALSQLRSPLTSLVANQRGRIVSAADGYRNVELCQERISKRRAVNITASLALSAVEKALVERVQDIDAKFDTWREKMAQFVSVASVSIPIPLPPTDPYYAWLKGIWCAWKTIDETRAMFNYLNTAMNSTDRLHLLGELITNQLNGNGR
jgi:hypothetical protein